MAELLPTQEIDARKMVESGNALNYSKAGSGKTLTAIEAVTLSGMQGGVVLAPPIALTMWAEVITEHTGKSVSILRTGRSPIKGEPDWIVSTYALAAGAQFEVLYDELYRMSDQSGGALILDEAHALKQRTSKRTRSVFGPVTNGRGGLFEPADVTYSLTGTPILRHADDLWSQLRATKPDVLRQYGVLEFERFIQQYCYTEVKQYHPRQRPQRVVINSKNMDELNQLIKDCGAIRRTVEEVAAYMPPITIRHIDLGKGRIKVPKGMTDEQIAQGLSTEDEILMKVWKEMGADKVEPTADYVLEAAKGSPVLVGYWFTENGLALAERLHRDCVVAVVNGATSHKARDEIRLAFNNGAIDVIVGQMGAMNTSWNLQEMSSHVVIMEDHFSAGIVEQFYKRVYRMGQGHHTQLDFMKFSNKLDEAVMRSRENKAVNQRSILDL